MNPAIPIPASATADRDLSDGSFRVLLYLVHRTGDGSDLVMRHQDIAAELNRSISTVARSLDELAARGDIARGRDRSVRGGPARIRVTKRARTGRRSGRDRRQDLLGPRWFGNGLGHGRSTPLRQGKMSATAISPISTPSTTTCSTWPGARTSCD